MDICGPCKFRNEDAKAIEYCITCQEPQCKVCSDIHRSSKATRNHLFSTITELSNASKTNEDLEKFQNCCDHPEKKFKFFCVDHRHLMCSTCLLNIQKHDCKAIVDIETAGKQIEMNKFNVQLTIDMETVIDHCKEKDKEIERLKEESHTKKQELMKYIEDLRNKILTHFNKCEKEIFYEVDKKVKTKVAELTSEQTVLRETLKTTKENKDILQMITNNNSKADVFRCTLSVLHQLDKSHTNKPSLNTDMYTHTVEFSSAFNTLLTSIDMHPIMQCKTAIITKASPSNVTLITDKDSFLETMKQVALTRESDLSNEYSLSSADADMDDPEAKIHRKQANAGINFSNTSMKSAQATASPRGTVTESQKVSNIAHVTDVTITTPDEKQLYITGIITLPDGDIVLSDCSQPRLIRVSGELAYKDSTVVSNLPRRMTVLKEKYILVCLPTAKRVAFVSLSPDFKCMRNTIPTKYTPKDVHAIDATRLLLSMYDASLMKWYLQILAADGAILQDISNARSLLDASHISSLKLTPMSQRYYIQCCKVSNALYCFESSGKEVFKYNVVSPKCLYIDNAGKIYVLDSFGSIHILTNDGKLLQQVDVPKEANGITYSKNNDTFYITKQCSDIIGVFKISH